MVEGITQGLFRMEEIRGTTVDEEYVHPTVVVVVEESTPPAYRFWQIPFRRVRIVMAPRNPAFSWGNLSKYDPARCSWYGSILRLRSFLRECHMRQAQAKNERREISQQHRLPASSISTRLLGLAE
jgi:hypothetical protein